MTGGYHGIPGSSSFLFPWAEPDLFPSRRTWLTRFLYAALGVEVRVAARAGLDRLRKVAVAEQRVVVPGPGGGAQASAVPGPALLGEHVRELLLVLPEVGTSKSAHMACRVSLRHFLRRRSLEISRALKLVSVLTSSFKFSESGVW